MVKANIHWSIRGEDRADYPSDGVESIPVGSRQTSVAKSRLPTMGYQPSELGSTSVIQLSSESVSYEPVMHELGDL
jgi:hypothetical protein